MQRYATVSGDKSDPVCVILGQFLMVLDSLVQIGQMLLILGQPVQGSKSDARLFPVSGFRWGIGPGWLCLFSEVLICNLFILDAAFELIMGLAQGSRRAK